MIIVCYYLWVKVEFVALFGVRIVITWELC